MDHPGTANTGTTGPIGVVPGHGSSPVRTTKSKRAKNVEVQRVSVGQMDPKLAFDRLQYINQAQASLDDKLVSSDYTEHLQRLVTFRNKTGMALPGVEEAVQRLRVNGSSAYTTLSSLITKRRRHEYFTSGPIFRRLKKRKELQDKITELRRSINEKEANSADDERSKLWRQICRKQIPKAAKQMANSYSNRLSNARRTSVFCVRETKKMWTRQGRLAKECSVRARKQMREMLLFWRKNEREERDARKRAEKEAAEQRRLEEEQREARRQAKKLNFLLTQTELFSHFVASKDKTSAPTSTTKIQVGVDFADVDDETLRAQAEQMARNAAERTRAQRDAFNNEPANKDLDFSKADVQQTVLQPRMLQATLKEYQLMGLSWMANLYEQGINGILADEMGLGKTIQAISLLAHLAETHGIWGPFLVVAPASTLHNWQQELARFVPSFKVLPYWGSVADRKMLRKFWPSSSKRPFARDSTFHVMVTSYQLVVTDQAFLQKVRWQYMVLDEAQAIKSSSSQRWNVLLGFQCRNRLLLTGTPIQNTMQELWALLHFIMPSLFDSHDEFSDWFSKDIESQAATDASSRGGGMAGFDHHQLARLHVLLKPFMLRRIKKDVQSELAPKVELELLCDLAPKQKRLYKAIKQRLPIAELMKSVNSDGEASASLMNLVMQFRKVCNHPELFERDPIVSPMVMSVSPNPHMEKTAGRLVWPGPLRSILDIQLPSCVKWDGSSPPGILLEKPRCSSLEIVTKPVLDLSEELVPVSIKFANERLPRAYIPPAIAPPITPVSSDNTNLRLSEDCYSTGRQILVPDLHPGIQDCGKLARLDALLAELKAGGHRVLLYNQMTRMIDLMEEYLQYRKYRYLRLDGSTRIADRRDMVTAWQTNPDIFVFLLSTRAGGLGINLTAADTVIFYDSDWNPTVDQQAMDRAHRLGQQKQVTVYRMVTRGSIEERIQQRAHQKDLVQKVVIAGGDFGEDGPPTSMRAKDVASLLLDEDDI